MKSTLLQRLELAPSLTRRDILLTLLPFLIWGALVRARPWILQPHCAQNPASCTKSQIPPMDQPALGNNSGQADGYSYFTQNLSGIITLSVPALYQAGIVALGQASPMVALSALATDEVIFIQTTGINGALTEAVRLVVQRPRPFVYGNAESAKDPQNYVSFYSGHTSFAAAACLCLLLILVGRGAPTFLLLLFAAISQGLVMSTASYRILAGRHFPSDVIAGAIMGGLVALAVAWAHRPRGILTRISD